MELDTKRLVLFFNQVIRFFVCLFGGGGGGGGRG